MTDPKLNSQEVDMSVIEPNYFKMRVKSEMPKWKQIIWRLFGKKDFGISEGYYVEGYWFRGICLVTKFECEATNE